MKLSLKQLVEASPALGRLGQEKLVGKSAYALAKNLGIIQPELQAYEKARISLVEQYGEADKDGNKSVLPIKAKEFLSKLDEVMAEEIELNIRKIVLPAESNIISGADLFLLDWMVTIEGVE